MEFKRSYVLSDIPRPDYDEPVELADDIAVMRSIIGLTLDYRCAALRRIREGADATVEVFSGAMADSARWLVDLKLEFRRATAARHSAADEAQRPAVQLRVTATMSPTRLAAHARTRGLDMAAAVWQDILTSDESTFLALADQSASGRQDNLLPGHFLNPVAQNDAGADALSALRAVEALIEHLVGCSAADRRWLAEQRPWVVSQAETYWEFGHANAIDEVRRMRPTLWAISNGGSERAWSSEDSPELIRFSARLTKAVRAAIYPKTVDRIRLEIRHLKSVPGAAELSLALRLRRIVEDATQRANGVRDAILARVGALEPLVPDALLSRLCELMMHLQNLYPDAPQRAADILQLLLSRGGIRCCGDEFPVSVAEARRLKRNGLVESLAAARQSSRDQHYPLTTRYQPLFELFSPSCQESGQNRS
ncbi:hypothetical protein [Ralstonia chuxiongensis]|uniref:Uncharacterized protein n=1 Tax=Ralstonia chuxiongensis TaxID=2957504 RepID=A0AA42BL92_9RALS|nr:hypothetical protein [Ralstonia chuxiongensis]MCP1173657.1 hypothetical protein [Ralstonia chuxiongensis]